MQRIHSLRHNLFSAETRLVNHLIFNSTRPACFVYVCNWVRLTSGVLVGFEIPRIFFDLFGKIQSRISHPHTPEGVPR